VIYRIRTAPEVQKELKTLPGYVRAQAHQVIESLATTPRPNNAKELRGNPGNYRLWLSGRWRIVYSVNDETQTVFILRVRRKQDINYEEL
jgi:mRNA interferase RelE/StbE